MRKSMFIVTAIAMLFVLLGCGKKDTTPEMAVLIRMMPSQEKYFAEKVIPEFENVYNCRIKVVTFGDMWDIEATLKLEKGSRNPTISLVNSVVHCVLLDVECPARF